MLLSPLLLLSAPIFAQNLEEATRLVVDSSGDSIVRSLRDASGSIVALSAGGSIRGVNSTRWQQNDSGLSWIVKNVASGDSGASVMAGKGLNNEAVTLCASGSEISLFESSTLGSEYPYVAIADRALVGAAMVVTDMDPSSSGIDYEGVLNVWDTTGNGTPNWSYTFPRTLNHYGGGVEISDDGSIIFAWKGNPNTNTCLVRVFNRAGNLISSGDLAVSGNYYSRQTYLSADGTRAYFGMGSSAVIWDVLASQQIHLENIGASFDAHAMSADGKRFAFGSFGWLKVFSETTPGNWTLLLTRSFSGSQYPSRLALDAEGTQLAYLVQTYAPAYDTLRAGMLDVDNNAVLFEETLSAPGTIYQLASGDCEISDDGSIAAFGTWGDSLNITPEAFTRDASGAATSDLDISGSVFDIDLDSDGDVLVGGNKSVHANTFGNGGSFWVADAESQDFHLEGVPRLGDIVNLNIADGWALAGFAATRALGSSQTPWGISELDTSNFLWRSNAYTVPAGGLTLPFTLPLNPSLAGISVHLQSAVFPASGTGSLTNKVSLRLIP